MELNRDYYNRDLSDKRLNYGNPAKRIFLNECLRQLHITKGDGSPYIRMPVEYNKLAIWHLVDDLMRPVPLSEHFLLLQKVKRRLFLDSKKGPRKSKTPKRNAITLSEVNYFKPLRYYWGVRKIPRNYLERAEQGTQNDSSQNAKRKLTDVEVQNELETSPLDLSTSRRKKCQFCEWQKNTATCDHALKPADLAESIKRVRYNEGCRVSKRALKAEEMLYEQQYRQLSAAKDKYLEALIRSTLYMETLSGLLAT